MGNICCPKEPTTDDTVVKYQPGYTHFGADVSENSSSTRSSPPPSRLRLRALYNFDAINQDDLPFRKGDLLEIDSRFLEDDWWMAVHLGNKQKGYIPSNYVAKDDRQRW